MQTRFRNEPAHNTKTAYRARDALVNAGLPDYQKGHKNRPNRYRLIFFSDKSCSINDTVSDTVCDTVSDTQSAGKTTHITKQDINKTKQNESLPSAETDTAAHVRGKPCGRRQKRFITDFREGPKNRIITDFRAKVLKIGIVALSVSFADSSPKGRAKALRKVFVHFLPLPLGEVAPPSGGDGEGWNQRYLKHISLSFVRVGAAICRPQ